VPGIRFEDPQDGADFTVGEGSRPYPLTVEIPTSQLHASFSRWNERVHLSPPAGAVAASQLRRPPKVSYRTIVNASVLPSQPHGGVRTFRAVGYSITFDYPAQLFAARLATARIAGSNRSASQTALAIDRSSLIGVGRFGGLAIPVNAANIRVLSRPFVRVVSALAGHSVAVSFTDIHGIPVLQFAPFTTTLQGTKVTERIFNAFVGDDEYELRCQFAADEQTIERACAEMTSTLRQTNAPTG
jgi:hypothetical protein